MKVIQPGREGPQWSHRFTCTGSGNGDGGCSAILQVDKDDLYRTYRCDYLGDRDYFNTFRCPLCGAETDVKVPPQIERALPSKSTWMAKHPKHRSSS